jgi:hypothetical protein
VQQADIPYLIKSSWNTPNRCTYCIKGGLHLSDREEAEYSWQNVGICTVQEAEYSWQNVGICTYCTRGGILLTECTYMYCTRGGILLTECTYMYCTRGGILLMYVYCTRGGILLTEWTHCERGGIFLKKWTHCKRGGILLTDAHSISLLKESLSQDTKRNKSLLQSICIVWTVYFPTVLKFGFLPHSNQRNVLDIQPSIQRILRYVREKEKRHVAFIKWRPQGVLEGNRQWSRIRMWALPMSFYFADLVIFYGDLSF